MLLPGSSKKVYLMILDGFGEGKDYPGNAITHARMPNLNRLRKNYPLTLLNAHGKAVGLPEGIQGGSEVGHFTIGAGRVIFQTLEEINLSIRKGDFFQKPAFLEACQRVKYGKKAALHLIGMISDQGVHSDIQHLFALLKLAKDQGIVKIYIHAITDGRDVPRRSAKKYIKILLDKIQELGMGPGSKTETIIATIIGRYYAMDRELNWDRTEKAYNLYTTGEGISETDPIKTIENAYKRGIETDYHIEGVILDKHGIIKDKDAVIFWNFRTDRTRQLTSCFTGESEIGFQPKKIVRPFFVCLGDYSKKAPVVFRSTIVKNNLGSIVSQKNLKQLRLAEEEKYAHVTFFFNSQVEKPFEKEDRIIINPKKRPATYTDVPEMCAREITGTVLKEIDKDQYSLIVQNFANADVVGHFGNFNAIIKACEILDECIGAISKKALEADYNLIITADHGNAEYMIYEENGETCPSHTTNPVIFLLVSKQYQHAKLKTGGGLADIAPTILQLLKLKKPAEMTGVSLITNYEI